MNKFVKRATALLGVAGLSLTLAACSNDKTVVNYKGGKITQTQYYDEMKKSQAGQSALSNMIISKILQQQYGSKVSQKEVNKEYDNYKKQYGSNFNSVLSQNGMTASSFKDNIKTNKLIEVALKDLKKPTKAQEEKAWKSYQPKVQVQQILVEKEDTAKEVITKLEGGAKFEDLVKQYSTDTASKKDDGKIAKFDSTDTTLDSAFKTAAFKLKNGEYTKTPVKTQYGYHIIKMISHPSKGKMEDHKKELDNQIYQNWLQDTTVMKSVLAKVIKNANVSIKDDDLKNVLSQYVTTTSSSAKK